MDAIFMSIDDPDGENYFEYRIAKEYVPSSGNFGYWEDAPEPKQLVNS